MSVTVTPTVLSVAVTATSPPLVTVSPAAVASVIVDVGGTGPQGPQGVAGVPGPAGSSYTHTQAIASATWTINHNLGYRPVVRAINAGSEEIEGAVTHTSVNQITLEFATPITGLARCV